jgi:hypothetical protein
MVEKCCYDKNLMIFFFNFLIFSRDRTLIFFSNLPFLGILFLIISHK